MTRLRAPIEGGYVRKTVSLPARLVRQIDVLLNAEPGLSMSAFITRAAEVFVAQESRKRKRKSH